MNKALQAASKPIIFPSHHFQISYSLVIFTSAEEILKVKKKPTAAQFQHFLKIFLVLPTAPVSVK